MINHNIKSKIFMGPIEIAGYFSNLSNSLKNLDINHDFITYYEHKFNYGEDTKKPFLLKTAKKIMHFSKNSNLLLSFIGKLIAILLQNIWGIISLFKYDVYIFGFGKSLLRGNVDLPILHLLNKTVIMVSMGSDFRPPYMDGFSTLSKDGNKEYIESLYKKTKQFKAKDKYYFLLVYMIILKIKQLLYLIFKQKIIIKTY